MSTNNPEGAADIIRGNQLADYSFNVSRSFYRLKTAKAHSNKKIKKFKLFFQYEFSGKFKLCGQGKSIDFYSKTNEVTVDFFSRSGRTKKGFQLDYSYAGIVQPSFFGQIFAFLFEQPSNLDITYCYAQYQRLIYNAKILQKVH